MVYHSLPCNVMVYHAIPWYIFIRAGLEKPHQILEEQGLQRNVMLPTHKMSHTLDLVISRISDPIVFNVAIKQ